jgi:DNA polymerase-3 subunit alpha
MMKMYIQNYHDPANAQYLHPVMKEQLEETFGVMVYQEDVIKICIHYAGMDGTDADILRRGMSGKYRSRVEFDRLVDKFHEGAKALGRPERSGGRFLLLRAIVLVRRIRPVLRWRVTRVCF